MFRRAAVIAALVVGLFPGTSFAYHNDRDCDWEGNCGQQEYRHDYSNHDRNRNRDRDRGAFSPGPFDRSPVNIWLCAPGSTCNRNPGDDQGQQPTGFACLVPFPYHCDPKPTL